MKYIKYYIIFILVSCALFLIPQTSFARENVDYWYIKDFRSNIVVNADSSLDITEMITADCGDAIGKHGIFRVIPTRYSPSRGKYVETPITLLSITNFSDVPYKYTSTKDRTNHTLSWKIGDPNVTVSGVNYFKIHYKVDNVIRFNNSGFDEFYWNLNGNYWDMETDHFIATIIYPNAVNKDKSEVNLYSGDFGESKNIVADYKWQESNIIIVESNKTKSRKNNI